MSIVIYGKGVVGQNFALFLSSLKISYTFLDNEDKLFEMKIQEIQTGQYIFICSSKKEYKTRMTQILLEKGIDKKYIKYYENDYFLKKTQKMLTKVWINSAAFFEWIEKDTSQGKHLGNILGDLVQKYKKTLAQAKQEYAKIQNELYYKEEDIFTEIYNDSNQNLNFKWYPYFANQILENAQDVHGFRDKIVWDVSAYEGCELICIFGDSQIYGVNVERDHTISVFLEKQLNKYNPQKKYKVINCALNASTIMHQMQMYLAFIEALNPKIVISTIGFDFFNSWFICEQMLSKHRITYYSYIEKSIKTFSQASTPLWGEAKMINPEIKSKDIINTVIYRLEQFSRLVCSKDIRFIACIEPFLLTKKNWHSLEKKMHYEWLDIHGSDDFNYIMEEIPKLVKQMYLKMQNSEFIQEYIDLNIPTKHIEDAIFDDYIHPNQYGNKLIAHYLANYLIKD